MFFYTPAHIFHVLVSLRIMLLLSIFYFHVLVSILYQFVSRVIFVVYVITSHMTYYFLDTSRN